MSRRMTFLEAQTYSRDLVNLFESNQVLPSRPLLTFLRQLQVNLSRWAKQQRHRRRRRPSNRQ